MLKVTPTRLAEVLVLEYETRDDARGPVAKTYSRRELDDAGIRTQFVEEYLYRVLKKGTLYGIHFQNNPKAQAKLIRVTRGRGLDYAVDLRKSSPTYLQWVCVELGPENGRQVYIPKGFGHAHLTLEDNTDIVYAIDAYHDPALSRAISYLDAQIGLPIPCVPAVLSRQDSTAPQLTDSDVNY